MPSFSSVLTSDASLKRGGGSVKCCVGCSCNRSSGCFSASGGSSASSCLPPGASTRRKPSNFRILPCALKTPTAGEPGASATGACPCGVAVDVHALVEALGDHHGALGVVVQADGRLLLERAGRERRRRLLGPVLLLDPGDDVLRPVQGLDDRIDLVFGGGLELLPAPLG